MSRIARDETRLQEAAAAESPVSETRIDAAHPVNGSSDVSPDLGGSEAVLPQSTVEGLSEETEEPLRRQAAQLAEYLRERQSELDHRESQLNAQVAQFESDARAARLWLAEREAEHVERQQAIEQKERECTQRVERLAATEDTLYCRMAGGDSPADSPLFAGQAGRASEPWGLSSKSAEQNRLAETQREVARLREQLLEGQRRLDEESRQEWQRIAAAQRAADAEVKKKRQTLQRRSEHLDRCRAALRQVRGELQQLHRETLEIRLATEELWIELAGTAPPAVLTHSLGRVRSRLADDYDLARSELTEQQKELEGVRKELAAQCEAFIGRKKQFEQWASTRQQQIELQARRLVAREKTIEEQCRDSLLQTAAEESFCA
jgi:hypothetical protein